MEISRPGYYWLDTWVLANFIQLTTQDFCLRYLNRTKDPCGRQFDQMTQAARSAPANIAEGNSWHSTSRETEMKLTDVARASLAELENDYLNWLLMHENVPWSVNDPEYQRVSNVALDRPTYRDDVQHLSSIHTGEPGTVLLISFSQVIEKETRTTRSRWRATSPRNSPPSSPARPTPTADGTTSTRSP